MRRSAPRASKCGTKLNALLLMGSIRLFGGITVYSVSAWQLWPVSFELDAAGTSGHRQSERGRNWSCRADSAEPALRQKSSSTAEGQSNLLASGYAQDNSSWRHPKLRSGGQGKLSPLSSVLVRIPPKEPNMPKEVRAS